MAGRPGVLAAQAIRLICVDVRRLAALDMALHGPRLILIEFAVGVVGCAVLGGYSVALGVRLPAHGFTWQLFLGIALL